ncbi:MAG: MAPEG family protein [Gammaproteobacteria bacterium]
MESMAPIAIVTLLILSEYFAFSILVARARMKAGIEPPAIYGEPSFERYFRIHQNTLEQLVITLPALWVFGYYVDAWYGAGLGLLFMVGRLMYCLGYAESAEKRTKGFIVGQLAQLILLLGGIIGAVMALF